MSPRPLVRSPLAVRRPVALPQAWASYTAGALEPFAGAAG
jgi:hypothetical protein